MNKRQAKKKKKGCIKECKKCRYYLDENICGLFLMGFPCIKDIKKKVE